METYQLALNNFCDSANTGIFETNNLITKLQELNVDLKQIEPLSLEIYLFFFFFLENVSSEGFFNFGITKGIRKNLDQFEILLSKLPK